METKEVRIPRQKRSIEKKEKIINAAYKIFIEKGFYNINTADIAKEAGFSTGTVYAYFSDKKDILVTCLYQFGDTLTQEICAKIESLSASEDILEIAKNVLYIFVNNFSLKKQIHDEVMSLQYRDEDVKKYFAHESKTMMKAVASQLDKCGYVFKNEREQSFLLFQMVKGIEDELLFNNSPDINQEILIEECARTIVSMLTKKETVQPD